MGFGARPSRGQIDRIEFAHVLKKKRGGVTKSVPIMDEQEFHRVARFLKKHMHAFNDEQKLQMYGLFKQAQFGDCPNDVCNSGSLVEHHKHRAWKDCRGMAPPVAMDRYVRVGKVFESGVMSKLAT